MQAPTPPVNGPFADYIHKHRMMTGLSQDRFAQEAGVSRLTIFRIEAGKHRANVETLRKLAAFLGVEVAALTALHQKETGAPRLWHEASSLARNTRKRKRK